MFFVHMWCLTWQWSDLPVGNTWVVGGNMWATMPSLVNGHSLRYIFSYWYLYFWKFSIIKYSHFDWTRVKGGYNHEYFLNYQFITNLYYNNPHQYMSLTKILKHAVEHNTWNITHFTTPTTSSSRMTLLWECIGAWMNLSLSWFTLHINLNT